MLKYFLDTALTTKDREQRRNFIKGLISGIILGASIFGWLAYGFPVELKIPRPTTTKTLTTTVSTTQTTTVTHVSTKVLTSTVTKSLFTSTSSTGESYHETSVNPTTVSPEFEPFVKLFPRAAMFNPVMDGEKLLYYEVYDSRNLLVGYAFMIKVLTCPDMLKVYGVLDLNYKVIGVDVEPSEVDIPHGYVTWWSKQVSSNEFEGQFDGLTIEELYIDRDGGKVHAVSGATLSSRAVTEAIRRKISAIISGEGHQDTYKPSQICPTPMG